jgi:hypothetical protein
MTPARALTICLSCADLVIAGCYLFAGDKARAWYWASAASISLSTLFIK